MGIDRGTVIRTIALVIVWINMVLTNYGLQPIPVVSEDIIAEILAGVVTVWTWFKNNYVTVKGKQQKQVLQQNQLIK
ncbi:phage holin [Oceanobacillus sojae]|uniref:phage holin n=1 Tax=Oceanobacillus sojae TaxID=582851 RepID=UPI0021A41328|nr:phage holin [Oceanobacillus sojae]MCT1901877.1 phage holin [Oceanobacillus sojae]